MAETVYLFLKANGIDIHGDSTRASLGRENAIECMYYEQGVRMSRETSTGLLGGRRQYDPIIIRKRVDRASPLLAKALVENQAVEGLFKFFRASPEGATEHFYSVQIRNGRVLSLKQYVPDLPKTNAAVIPPAMEEIAFIFQSISWTHIASGIAHEDVLSRSR